jgi:hypothetical protein
MMIMKRIVLLVVMLMGLGEFTRAQTIPSSVIDINNVRGSVLGTGNAYSNLLGNDLTWEVPKGSGKNSLFQYSLWIGAMDINYQIHVAAHRYNQDGRDYWMGPLSLYGANSTSFIETQFEHIWNLTKTEIDEFISNYGQPGYEIPEDILSWPVHGNVNMGFAPYLAPFVDVNGDGRYNPEYGDYPDVLGDQCLFFIFNDGLTSISNIHGETGGDRLGLEVHAMVYAYDAPEDEFLNNTVFFHYDLINRSTFEFYGTYVGVWNDWIIGNNMDDYVGCNVRLGACYGYNGNAFDVVYGDNPPVQLCTILAGPYMDPDGLDNLDYSGDCDGFTNYYHVNYDNGVADDERLGLSRFVVQSDVNEAMGDPHTAEETYRTMRGFWIDGTRVMYGGDGYNMTFGPQCDFMFPGDSDPCNYGTNGVLPNGGYNVNGKYWTENEAGNAPGERRGLAVVGPFVYKPGAVQPFDFALTTVWKSDSQSALDRIEDAVNAVRQKFEEVDWTSVVEHHAEGNPLLKVYPNPATGTAIVEGVGRLVIVNVLGQQVLTCHVDGQTTLALPAGLYFIRLENENGISISKLLVK